MCDKAGCRRDTERDLMALRAQNSTTEPAGYNRACVLQESESLFDTMDGQERMFAYSGAVFSPRGQSQVLCLCLGKPGGGRPPLDQ